MEPLIVANLKFSIDLLKKLCKVNTGNVLFSPLSISSALGPVVLGANGQTAAQMYKTLHFNHEKIMYHDLYDELYKGGNYRSLKLVNRLFGERTLNFKDDFLDMCEEWCYTNLRNADFKTDPEAARKRINDWVQNKTEKNIKNYLDKGDVTKDTSLVLISAVHFMDKWVNPFKSVPVNQDKGVNWPMMSRMDKFPLGNIPHRQHQPKHPPIARILEIPYANKDMSMIIILPNQSDRLPENSLSVCLLFFSPSSKLVESITYEKLLEWTEPDNMIYTDVAVKIPLFKMQENYNLEEVLKSLGITDLFDEKCDLSGMAPGLLKLPKVMHKSSVEVNEEGTEADAGGDAVVHGLSLSNKIQGGFVADRPFLFFIRHNPTKSIIFWSRFISP
ncbi:leukocyte elastase inhibitor-like [Rhinichthys klamathensis goyatoka]|uniref:leukocyte elastase inhibitor-like n=1 Tax=Rhinichthys klamathensis goyatoka TaxID=3034132 RepID=UPI0024B498F7|nr:leukocyte elastase inhibitor-like [Rhinichthys klamathensis goyatoka]